MANERHTDAAEARGTLLTLSNASRNALARIVDSGAHEENPCAYDRQAIPRGMDGAVAAGCITHRSDAEGVTWLCPTDLGRAVRLLMAGRPPASFHEQRDGTLVCKHRDVSCCDACADEHEEIVEVSSAHFWINEPGVRAELARVE